MINVKHKKSENKGQFTLIDENKEIGLMTYSLSGNQKMIIEHTEVSPDYKGEGLGEKLVYEAVDFARKEKLKISPHCGFAKSIFTKNEEIQDVKV